MVKDYYYILDVSNVSDIQEIKSAYRKLAKMWHPDICKEVNAHEKFVEINEAYEILSDPKRREEYDYLLKMQDYANEEDSYEESKTYNENTYNDYYSSYQKARDEAHRRSEEYAKTNYEDFVYKILETILEVGVFAVSSIIETFISHNEKKELERTKVNSQTTSSYLEDGIKAKIIDNTVYFSGTGVLSNNHTSLVSFKNITKIVVGNGISGIKKEAFKYCNKVASLDINDGVSFIGDEAFSGSDFIEINISNSVKRIGKRAFSYCKKLEKISLPDSIESLEAETFKVCSNLKSIKLPNSLKQIEEYTFYNCKSLQRIEVPATVTSIGDHAFYDCESLIDIDISKISVTSIEKFTFSGCKSLKSLILPDTLESIGEGAFYGSELLESISVPKSVRRIEKLAFKNCRSLKTIELPPIITIENELFKNCRNLQSVNIPDTVYDIKPEAFQNCYSLGDVYMPASIKKIGYNAFKGCSKLNLVAFNFKKVKIDGDALKNTPYGDMNAMLNKKVEMKYRLIGLAVILFFMVIRYLSNS